MEMEKPGGGSFIISIVTPTIIVVMVSMLEAIPTYLLWNLLMPKILGIKTINFLEAWGVNILSEILFRKPSLLFEFFESEFESKDRVDR
jgi:hypothetical protein